MLGDAATTILPGQFVLPIVERLRQYLSTGLQREKKKQFAGSYFVPKCESTVRKQMSTRNDHAPSRRALLDTIIEWPCTRAFIVAGTRFAAPLYRFNLIGNDFER